MPAAQALVSVLSRSSPCWPLKPWPWLSPCLRSRRRWTACRATRYALAFGGPLAASVPGMVVAGRWSDRHGPLRATVGGHAEQVADLQVRERPNLP